MLAIFLLALGCHNSTTACLAGPRAVMRAGREEGSSSWSRDVETRCVSVGRSPWGGGLRRRLIPWPQRGRPKRGGERRPGSAAGSCSGCRGGSVPSSSPAWPVGPLTFLLRGVGAGTRLPFTALLHAILFPCLVSGRQAKEPVAAASLFGERLFGGRV